MFGFFNRAKKVGKGPTAVTGAQAVRSFGVAEMGRELSPWVFDGGFSNVEIAAALATIRTRSRDMQKNSPQFSQYFRQFKNNVVGCGFTLRAQPCEAVGDPTIDEAAKAFIQYHFWKWSKDRDEVDLTGRKSFARMCRLVAENWARDGEGIILIERNAPTVYGLQLRVVRPDALDEKMNGQGFTANTVIRNGVEIDRRTKRPVAYYFNGTAEDPMAAWYNSKPYVRVPASDVIHIFTQHDECQTRGIPLGHASLKKAKMLDEFDLSELVAARDEANTTGIFHAPADREDEIKKLNEDTAASNYVCQKSEPGTKYVLPPGWDYDPKTPQHPNREVSSFKNSMLRDVASGLGVEYACFANDWAGVSFSSVRAGTLAERDNYTTLQDDFVEMVVAPVFKAWLAQFLTRTIANPYVPSDFARLCEFEFQARTWAWVDPMKDVQADAIAVEHGWKTNEEVTAQYGGSDFKENCARLAEENAAKKQAGILTAPQITKGEKPGKEKDEGEE